MKKYSLSIFTAFLLCVLYVTVASAAGLSGYRTIVDIGCHLTNNTCYAYLDGEPVGPPECQRDSIRWNEQTAPNGKSTLALLTSAFMAGKKVSFYVTDVCYEDQPAYPTFSYINVQK